MIVSFWKTLLQYFVSILWLPKLEEEVILRMMGGGSREAVSSFPTIGFEVTVTCNERTLPRSLDYASSLGLRSAR